MEARFPGSKRTFTKLKGVEVAGGDMHLIQPSFVTSNVHYGKRWPPAANKPGNWRAPSASRFCSNCSRAASRLPILKHLVLKLTGQPASVRFNPNAEMAMDGDKPHQVDLLRAEIAEARARHKQSDESIDWLARDKAVVAAVGNVGGHGRFRRPSAWVLARSGDSLFWLAVIALLLWQKQGLGWDLLWTVRQRPYSS